jgi:hypothetical protein
VLEGLDGNTWVVRVDKNGRKSWKKASSASTRTTSTPWLKHVKKHAKTLAAFEAAMMDDLEERLADPHHPFHGIPTRRQAKKGKSKPKAKPKAKPKKKPKKAGARRR